MLRSTLLAVFFLALNSIRLLHSSRRRRRRDAIRSSCRADFMANCSGVHTGRQGRTGLFAAQSSQAVGGLQNGGERHRGEAGRAGGAGRAGRPRQPCRTGTRHRKCARCRASAARHGRASQARNDGQEGIGVSERTAIGIHLRGHRRKETNAAADQRGACRVPVGFHVALFRRDARRRRSAAMPATQRGAAFARMPKRGRSHRRRRRKRSHVIPGTRRECRGTRGRTARADTADASRARRS